MGKSRILRHWKGFPPVKLAVNRSINIDQIKQNMPRIILSVVNTEKLVELVRKHPLLYDPTCHEHKDSQRVHNLWNSIAKVMHFDKMDGK